MTRLTATRQQPLFPSSSPRPGGGEGRTAGRSVCLPRVVPGIQQTLWPDPVMRDLIVPQHIVTRLPRHLTDFRARLQAQFKASHWDVDSAWASDASGVVWIPREALATYDAWCDWAAEQRRQLQQLIANVGYTKALVDGPYRLFIEYRACDSTPHYRLTYAGVLWGRADIYVDLNVDANILASPTLSTVQKKLAAYVHLVGCRPETAQLRPHLVADDGPDDEDQLMKPRREHRLFKTSIEREIPTARKRKRK